MSCSIRSVLMRSCCISERRGRRWRLDSPNFPPPLPSAFQKGQGSRTTGLIPSDKTTILCSRKFFFPIRYRACYSLSAVPIDPASCPGLQPRRAEAAEDADAWQPMDLVHGRASLGRPYYCRWLRPQALLVRSRAQRQALQNHAV